MAESGEQNAPCYRTKDGDIPYLDTRLMRIDCSKMECHMHPKKWDDLESFFSFDPSKPGTRGFNLFHVSHSLMWFVAEDFPIHRTTRHKCYLGFSRKRSAQEHVVVNPFWWLGPYVFRGLGMRKLGRQFLFCFEVFGYGKSHFVIIWVHPLLLESSFYTLLQTPSKDVLTFHGSLRLHPSVDQC